MVEARVHLHSNFPIPNLKMCNPGVRGRRLVLPWEICVVSGQAGLNVS